MNKSKISVPFLILDIIGFVLIGVGMFEKIAGPQWVPEAYRFANYEIYMIVIGFALTIPFAISTFLKNKK